MVYRLFGVRWNKACLANRLSSHYFKNTDKAQRFLDKSSEEIQPFVKDRIALRAAEPKVRKAEEGRLDESSDLLMENNQTLKKY